MTDLVNEDYFHTDETKRAFVEEYFRVGSLRQAARNMNLSYDTVKRWKPKEWFKELYTDIEDTETRVRQRRISKLVDKSLDALEKTLDGEERLTKDGEIVRVEPSLSAVTMAVGVLIDKGKALKQDTPKPEDTADQIIARLAEKLRASVPEPKVIDVEATVVTENSARLSLDSGLSERVPAGSV